MGPVVLLAHDMGTSVATELLARDLAGALPFELLRAVLTNGSVILERASLRPSQKILRGPLGPLFSRLTNERGFIRGVRQAVQRGPSAVEAGGARRSGRCWPATTASGSCICCAPTSTSGCASRRAGTARCATGASR